MVHESRLGDRIVLGASTCRIAVRAAGGGGSAEGRRNGEEVRVVSAVDRANPWGAVLPWPDHVEAVRPKRVAGARLVCVGGKPVLYVERSGRSWVTLSADEEVLRRAIRAWVGRRGAGRVERIDGAPAAEWAWAGLLREEGFAEGYRGFEKV